MKSLLEKFHLKKEEAGGFKNLMLHTAFALTLTSGLSYGLGLIRDKTFAYTFGASSQLDIYNAAFVVPDLFLALLVTGTLSSAFVPIFSQLDEQDKKKAIGYTNQVLTFGMLILGALLILFAITLPYFAEWIVPGFDPGERQEYIKVTRLMLLSPLLFTLSNTLGNVLISIKAFLWYGLAPAFYNIGIIIGVFFFAPTFGVFGLVMGTILGAFLHLGIRLPAAMRYGWRPRFDLKINREMKETAVLMIPKMAQIGMWQLMLWWFVRLATTLEEGSVTVYSFARNFQSMPVSLIGIAIALAAFAQLSHLAASKEYTLFKKTVIQKTGTILGVTTLAAVGLALMSTPLIQILLGGGKFDDSAVRATAALLMVYCLAIPLESWMHLLARTHYALKNTLRPSMIHVMTIALTMGLSQYLIGKIGLYAIPVAFSTGLAVQVSLLVISLVHLLKKFSLKERLKSVLELK